MLTRYDDWCAKKNLDPISIKPHEIETFLYEGGEWSQETRRLVYSILACAYNLGIKREMLEKSPMLAVDCPPLPPPDIYTLTLDQLRAAKRRAIRPR